MHDQLKVVVYHEVNLRIDPQTLRLLLKALGHGDDAALQADIERLKQSAESLSASVDAAQK